MKQLDYYNITSMQLKTERTLNKVNLYFGDCLDQLAGIANDSIQLIITSPPYNIGKEYEKRTSIQDYLDWQTKIIQELNRVLKPGGSVCWQVGNYVDNGEVYPLDILFYPIFKELGLNLRNRIIWHFEHGLHCTNRFSGRHETILWFTKGNNWYFDVDPVRVPQKYPNKKHFKGPNKGKLSGNPLGKNPGDVWIIPNVKHNHIEKTIHPCQFPVELVQRLVLSMTLENDYVLDPFMGVGSSLVAARIHNRNAIGAEINEEYYKVAIKRIKDAELGRAKVRPMGRSVYDQSLKRKSTQSSLSQLVASFEL
jgi:adenine-specific DNA-methyltransferase